MTCVLCRYIVQLLYSHNTSARQCWHPLKTNTHCVSFDKVQYNRNNNRLRLFLLARSNEVTKNVCLLHTFFNSSFINCMQWCVWNLADISLYLWCDSHKMRCRLNLAVSCQLNFAVNKRVVCSQEFCDRMSVVCLSTDPLLGNSVISIDFGQKQKFRVFYRSIVIAVMACAPI